MKTSTLMISCVLVLVVIISLYFYLNSNTSGSEEPPITSAGSVCINLPKYVGEFYKNYENVEIKNDTCYPTFRFETPKSYSAYGMQYTVSNIGDDVKVVINAKTRESIEEYDRAIRERINKTESCLNFKRFVELSNFTKLPLNFPRSCENMDSDIDTLEDQKVIRDFLASENKFGNYTSCKWERHVGGESTELEYSGSKKSGEIQVYVICDGIKETIKLIVQKDSVVKAYFQNSYSESYRQIYPEDIILTERKPKWE